MNIEKRRVKGTPFTVVMYNWNTIGVFERKNGKEIYIDRKYFTPAMKKAADLIHALTMKQRLEV